MAHSNIDNITIIGMASAIPQSEKGISVEKQTASDLAFAAVNQIFAKLKIDKDQIGVLIFLSSTPDYRSPATAMVLQSRLGVNSNCISFDLNVGGCGFLQGMHVGASLLKSLHKKYALVLLGDTPSKQITETESNEKKFSDAGTAIILEKGDNEHTWVFSTLTKSKYFDKFILRNGGYRNAMFQGNDEPYTGLSELGPLVVDQDLIGAQQKELIPLTIEKFLSSQETKIDSYDFLLYDHNDHSIYEHIKEILKIKDELTYHYSRTTGNSRGSFLPLLITQIFNEQEDLDSKTYHLLLTSFGEGLTTTIADVNLNSAAVLPVVKTDRFYEGGMVDHQM